jgi:hypothetical protein
MFFFIHLDRGAQALGLGLKLDFAAHDLSQRLLVLSLESIL